MNVPLPTRPSLLASDALRDKRVAIIGTENALGRALAAGCARLGAVVASGGAAAAAPDIGWHQAVAVVDPDEVERWVEAAWAHLGGCDLLVNATSRQAPGPALTLSLDDWKAVIDSNLNGAWFVMHAMARRWRDAGAPGSIVSVISPYQRGMPGAANDSAASAGVMHLTRALAIEWAPYRIRVNCVAAGAITDTERLPHPRGDALALAAANPMHRAGSVDDVLAAVLLQGAGSDGFINGDLITVDGGGVLWGESWPVAKPDFFKVRA